MGRSRTARWLLAGVLFLVAGAGGCGKLADDTFCDAEGCSWSGREWTLVASLALPDGSAPPPDPSNAVWNSGVAAGLGQQFFFDPAFSGSATQTDAIKRPSPPARAAKGQPINISCATCHDPSHAGTDRTSVPGNVSVGAGWTDVNALPVVNAAYRNVVFWNGRADSLWALNVAVAESGTTMGGNRLRTAHQVAERYRGPFTSLFGSIPLDPIAAMPADGKPGDAAYDGLSDGNKHLVDSVLVAWSKAIAAYEYQLVSGEAPFDRFVKEGPSSTAISASAKRGARLFVGKGACIDCHAGPQLTDEDFHDIGVPQAGMTVPTLEDCPDGGTCDCVYTQDDLTTKHASTCAPFGAYDGLQKLAANKWLRTSSWSDDPNDQSRDAYVKRGADPSSLPADLQGAWRTPSLRNAALTGPYMHDGVFATLEEVVWHYNAGGQTAGGERIGVKAPQVNPLMLTDAEVADLVAFLETLTGAPPPPAWTTAPVLP
jgi:cytochrome c peroxidase